MLGKKWVNEAFQGEGLLFGVIHLLPLPGSPRGELAFDCVVERALNEAKVYQEHGFDGLILENHGDAPFQKDRVEPQITAMMAVATHEVRQASGLPVGINILRNASVEALGAAVAAQASFIRVNVLTGVTATDQGLIEGTGKELLRVRAQLRADIAICADIDVKYGVPLYDPGIEDLACSTFSRGGADALIVSGKATGAGADLEEVRRVKAAVPEAVVLVGSGVTPETVAQTLEVADGAIIGSCCKVGGYVENPLDEGRIAALMQAAGR